MKKLEEKKDASWARTIPVLMLDPEGQKGRHQNQPTQSGGCTKVL